MADQMNNAEGLQKPVGMQQPKEELLIHVIPEKFHGMALKKKLPKVMPEKPVVAGPAPRSPEGAKGGQVVPKKNTKLLLILVIAGVLLLGGGVAAYFLLAKKPVIVAPICGNAQCEVGETVASCAADCTPPAVCGNGSCETGETAASCAADCKPPALCGNKTCEEGETAASCAADCTPPAVCGNGKCETDETTASCAADCKPPEPLPGTDTDSDGLTDLEERSIYQTDPRLSNSDGDTYVDLNEVLNLFDPHDPNPTPLTNNSGISVHSDATLGYEIYRPTGWTVGAGPEGQTRFNAPTGEHVDVLVDDLAAGDTLHDWYLALDPTAGASAVSQTTRQGYEYLVSSNRMSMFILGGNRVFIVSYDLNGSSAVQYRVTFEMMVNSFRLRP
jgi:hypothetical protein